MTGADVVRLFEEQRPVCVMAQMALERLLSPEEMDKLFRENAQGQYERSLLFSSLAKLMASVVLCRAKSVNAAYKKMAQWGKRVWMKHGAIGYYECLGDDLKGMPGCGTFTKLAKVKPGETVFFSFIIYKSKAHRNAVNKRVMAEMKKSTMPPDMPFVPGRMAFGGFRTIVQG